MQDIVYILVTCIMTWMLKEKKSRLGRLFTFALFYAGFLKDATADPYTTDACRSIHGRLGTCVPLRTCPLFYDWLKVRPVRKENLRLLVEFTCFFDLKNPKVCCPNGNLYRPPPSNGFENVIGIRLAVPHRRVLNNSQASSKKITFPEPSSAERASSPYKGHSNKEEGKYIKTGEEKRSFTPLLFPTEQADEDFDQRSNFAQKPSDIWSPDSSYIKDSSILKKDLRHHPNFRLIPPLSGCSNAVKLDSLLGTYAAYPWIALIGVKRMRSLQFQHVCAGAVINNRYILTAAHCFGKITNTRIGAVRLGEYNLDTLIDDGSEFLPQSRREDFKIEKLERHPNYDPDTGANDIALIRVDKPIPLNTTFIRAVCLPFLNEYGIDSKLDVKSSSDWEGKAAWVAGWSRHFWDGTSSTGYETSIIREGIVEFTKHEKCVMDYPVLSPFSSQTQICVGGKGRRNSCVPDSGGPLMFPLKVPSRTAGFVEPKFFMLGLLSHGITGNSCPTIRDDEDETSGAIEEASRSLPSSVYTRVSKYLPWILDNMQE